ncbi:MAG: polymer-forming cytoskeletal protein [Candidatus Paceibacterota bacterium]|jgi:cytoskeletal protein CcmA (bactofilin family)
MKKTFWYGAVAVALIAPLATFAAEFRMSEQPAVLASENVAGDIYLFGSSATSAGPVSGDVIAGGGNVVISGTVGADVMAGGGNVTILSNVGDDVRAGGGNVVILGKVGGDVIVGGGQVNVGGPGVGGDVVAGAGTVRIDAPVAGNLKIGGGNIYINAPITGTVTITDADKVTLGPSAVIYGNLSYKASKELIKENGADVRGEVKYTPRAERKAVPAALIAGLISAWILGKFFVVLVSALIIGLLLRRYSMEVVTRATARPLAELGRGLLALIALPIVSIILLVTILGIPFGILGIISFIALMVLTCVVAPIIVGSVVWKYFSNGDTEITWKTILIGVFVFQILGFVPFVGWLVQAVVGLIAAGVIVSIKWEVIQSWK